MAARGGAEAWLGVPVVKCECRRSRSPVEIRGRRWRLFGRMSHGSRERLALAGDAMASNALGGLRGGRYRQGPPDGPAGVRATSPQMGHGAGWRGVRSIASVDAPLRLQAGSFNGDELLRGDLRKANR